MKIDSKNDNFNKNIDNLNSMIGDFQVELNSFKKTLSDTNIDFDSFLDELTKLQKISTSKTLEEINKTLQEYKKNIESIKTKFIDDKLDSLQKTVDENIQLNIKNFSQKFDVFYNNFWSFFSYVQKKYDSKNWFLNSKIWKRLSNKWKIWWYIAQWINWATSFFSWLFWKNKSDEIIDYNWLWDDIIPDPVDTINPSDQVIPLDSSDTYANNWWNWDLTWGWGGWWVTGWGDLTDSDWWLWTNLDWNTNLPNNNWIIDTWLTWIWWGVLWFEVWNFFRKNIKNINTAKQYTWNELKSSFEKISKYIEVEIKNPNLTKVQIKSLTRYKKIIDDISLSDLTQWTEWLKAWKKLVNKVPQSFVKNLDISSIDWKILKWFESLENWKIDVFLKSISWKTEDEINILRKNFIQDNWLWNELLNPQVRKILQSASNVDEFKNIVKLSESVKWMKVVWKWLIALDAVFIALEIFDYSWKVEWFNNMKNDNYNLATNKIWNARFEMWVNIASIMWWTAIFLTWMGPPWRVWLAVWLWVWATIYWVTEWVKYIWHHFYYDIADYYFQWKSLYYYKTLTKQFLYNAIWTQTFDYSQSKLEDIAMFFNKNLSSVKIDKNIALDEWLEALVFLDKLENIDSDFYINFPLLVNFLQSWKAKKEFFSSLSQSDKIEFNSQWNSFIWDELSYMKNILDNSSSKFSLLDIDSFLKEARFFSKYKWEISDFDIVSFRQSKLEDLSQQNAWLFSSLEKLKDDNFDKYLFFISWLKYYISWLDLSQDLPWYKDWIEFVLQYNDFVCWFDLKCDEKKYYFDDFDYNDIQYTLDDLLWKCWKKILFWSDEKNMFFYWSFFERAIDSDVEYSWKMGQDMIYLFFKKFHNYVWKNDMVSLINFSKWIDKDILWMYYEDWYRKSNIINWNDKKIDFSVFDDAKTMNWLITSMKLKIPNDKKTDLDFISNQIYLFLFKDKDNLDTPTENIDTQINTEFENIRKKIIKTELNDRFFSRQNVQKNVMDYIIKNWNNANWKFFRLPVYLNEQCVKVWLWDYSWVLFEYKWFINWRQNIVLYTRQWYYNQHKNMSELFDFVWWSLVDFWNNVFNISVEIVDKLNDSLDGSLLEKISIVDKLRDDLNVLVKTNEDFFSVDDINYVDELNKKYDLWKDSLYYEKNIDSDYKDFFDLYNNVFLSFLNKRDWLDIDELDSLWNNLVVFNWDDMEINWNIPSSIKNEFLSIYKNYNIFKWFDIMFVDDEDNLTLEKLKKQWWNDNLVKNVSVCVIKELMKYRVFEMWVWSKKYKFSNEYLQSFSNAFVYDKLFVRDWKIYEDVSTNYYSNTKELLSLEWNIENWIKNIIDIYGL